MRFCAIILLLTCFSSVSPAQGSNPPNILTNDHWDFIGVNRMLMWVSNNGRFAHNPLTDNSGLEWPAGSGKHLVFTAGLVTGGLITGEARVGGATYNPGWQAGNILPDGTTPDPSNPLHRIFHVRRFDPLSWNLLSPAAKIRMLRDIHEWPVQLGAPWVDNNSNGMYDPDTLVWQQGGVTDIPRIPGEEALWFVSNDLDSRRMLNHYGSNPMGMEMHTMIWASPGHPLLENVVFREHTIIHKGIDDFYDAYFGAWEDMDHGDFADDCVGVDTARALAYTYNGRAKDLVYPIPPAAGTVWLQTPVTPRSGSTARFGRELREGYANLPLSSFTFYISGSSVYCDPALKTQAGGIEMLNNLSGKFFNGQDMLDPTTGGSTSFAVAGDPVLSQGWIDGIVHAPDERRAMSSCGPFTLAVGDTQKVLFAHIATDGGNYLLSVRALRNAARQLHDIYRNIPMGSPAPVFSSAISFLPTPGGYELQVRGGPFPLGTVSVSALLRKPDGGELARISLADDGANGDLLANDGIYGGTFAGVTPAPDGADLFVLSTGSDGVKEWFVESEIPTSGEARVSIAEIVSDSRNFDGVANPGENLRIRLRFENNSTATLGPWHLFLRDSASLLAEWTVLRHSESTPAGENTETVYDPANKQTYLSVTIPEDTPGGTTLRFPVTLMSGNYHAWNDTLRIEVEDYGTPPTHGLLAHVEGNAFGTLGYSILEPRALTEHDYRVSVEGEDFGTKTLHVEDVTLGTTLHRGLKLPEKWVHDSPTIDGWRLSMGTAFDELVYDQTGNKLASFQKTVTGEFSEPSRAWFPIYQDQLMIGKEYRDSNLGLYDVVPVKLVFDRNDGQKALGYMRGAIPNYGYQGYFSIPVRAYDMTDTTRPRQIMLGFTEQINSAGADSTWMPTAQVTDREVLLIFLDDYAAEPDPKFKGVAFSDTLTLDLLYTLLGLRDSTLPDYADGDSYSITAPVPVSNRDVYILAKPRLLDARSEATQPESVALHANFPNPFGPGSENGASSTTLSFDTPHEGHVRIAVYDLLGRRVATILDQTLPSGSHTTRFSGDALRSGMYLLSLEAEGVRSSRTMMVLK